LNGVLIALDRQEKGKDTTLSAIQQVEQDYNIKVTSIVGLHHVLSWLEDKVKQDASNHPESVAEWMTAIYSIKRYRKEWGISL
jgi:orotate phosphoribosyltransferase